MEDDGAADKVLTGRADADHRRLGRGAATVAECSSVPPVTYVHVARDGLPDLLLRLVRVEAPQIRCVLDGDLAVDDVDPHRGLRLALHDDPVIAGVLDHRGPTAAEVGTCEPADRVLLHADTGDLRTS